MGHISIYKGLYSLANVFINKAFTIAPRECEEFVFFFEERETYHLMGREFLSFSYEILKPM